jgi:hypothetical protein
MEQNLRLFHCNGEVKHRCFLRCFVFDGEHSRHPHCANVSVAKFLDYDHDRRFFKPNCGSLFICDKAVIQNQRINLVFGLLCRCCSWSAPAGASPISFSPLLKRRTQHPHHTHFSDVLGIGDFRSKKSITILCQYARPQYLPLCTSTVLDAPDWLEHRWSWWSWIVVIR